LEEALSKARVAFFKASAAVSESVLIDSSKRRMIVRKEDFAEAFLIVRTFASSTLLIADLMFGTNSHPLWLCYSMYCYTNYILTLAREIIKEKEEINDINKCADIV